MTPRISRSAPLLAFALTVLPAVAAVAACEVPPALPDTTGFAAELATFAALPDAERATRVTAATRLSRPWLRDFTAADGKVRRDLAGALQTACLRRWGEQVEVMEAMPAVDILSAARADLAGALDLDPTCDVARVALGLVLQAAGEVRAGAAELGCALGRLAAAGVEPDDADEAALRRSLLRTAGWSLALGLRNLGLWDAAEAAATMVTGREDRRADGLESLVHGLCLGGRGRTAEAITWAVRMPPLKYQHASLLGTGRYARPGSFANDWIRSQALLSSGDARGARGVLGEIDERQRQFLPLAEAYWQDAGLACELAGDEAARRCYERAHGRAPLWFARPTEGTSAAPLVLGFPAAGVPFFTTVEGAFCGGSPFGYLARQLSLVGGDADGAERDATRLRALELCDVLLRRNLRPDVVRALRGRLHLAAGCPHLARSDLEFAHAAFAEQGVVDAGTSQLLGLQELEANRPEAARALLAEAAAAAPTDALNWRHLGVVLGQLKDFDGARTALEKALALDPASVEGCYNLGVLSWQQGRPQEALAHLEKAWGLQPGNERVQVMLQTVATALRESNGARPARSGN